MVYFWHFQSCAPLNCKMHKFKSTRGKNNYLHFPLGMPPAIDPSVPWRLSHILDGHTSDVKSVCASSIGGDVELIHSASRDETGRSWYRNKDDLSSFQRGASYQGKRFQNAVSHLASTSTKSDGEHDGDLLLS
jgi:hypothetical protein